MLVQVVFFAMAKRWGRVRMKERSYPKVDAMIFRREWREAFKRGTGVCNRRLCCKVNLGDRI